MTKYETTARVGPDGTVTLPVPPAVAGVNAEVRVTVELANGRAAPVLDRAAWDDFIRRTAGSITDPTFQRAPQGELQERDSFP